MKREFSELEDDAPIKRSRQLEGIVSHLPSKADVLDHIKFHIDIPSKGPTFLDLPWDIQQMILDYLSVSDRMSLSSVNKSYRFALQSILFKRIKTDWKRLVTPEARKFLDTYKYFILELRITEADLYGEWQVDINDYIYDLTSLRYLVFHSKGSSSWLKYRANHYINKLSLVQDDRKSELLKPNFSLLHVVGFANLATLHLTNYSCGWYEGIDTISLREIYLTDCVWEYPFHLCQFNPKNELRKLHLTYTGYNSFVSGERWNKLWESNLDGLASLEVLEVYLEGVRREKDLTFSILTTCLKLPNMLFLKLRGWTISLNNLYYYLRRFQKGDTRLITMELAIRCQDDDYYKEKIRDYCQHQLGFGIELSTLPPLEHPAWP
ncbi:uncharacterized protein KQ657_003544 [Scheffersomyces spartinae]|uniref:F-box domain-containing protein n=1 Tax=Scheffersomyces spartinae TaxID=45513 RepID=A0A9P7V576_9ASCO|nr:uncharacterized protein KQ657_003544 [Scheffersomyces spartinae]KAG7191339.1 hypothetical protein KQ657_003544 [Scheffersomyces spartinae]